MDLRCVPRDGRPGAGIEHAARELWEACEAVAPTYGVKLIPIYEELRRACLRHHLKALLVPSGAVAPGLPPPIYPWVHDLAIFDHPEWFPQAWLKRQLTTRLFLRGLRKARHIFAVSASTAHEIEHRLGSSTPPITITHEGVTGCHGFLSREERWAGEVPPTIILGTIEPRKNIPFIISLWPEVCRRLEQTVSLKIIGKEGWGNVHINRTIPGVERVGEVSNQIRDQFLGRAALVMVSSLHEGFGRVALEAMAAGTPVIVSDRGALPEVVGEGGTVIPLESPENWINTMVRAYQDRAWWEQQSRQGQRRSELFSWERVARMMLVRIAQD